MKVNKLVALPPDLLEQCEALAQQDERFTYNGQPSISKVIRTSLVLFLAHRARYDEQSINEAIEAAA